MQELTTEGGTQEAIELERFPTRVLTHCRLQDQHWEPNSDVQN
jgi:hypothetical protein